LKVRVVRAMAENQQDNEDQQEDAEGIQSPGGRPWSGSSIHTPPYDPNPPTRPMHVLSTTRRQPQWTMNGRGDDMVIEYILEVPEPGRATVRKTFVRARHVKTRPVPQNAQEPDSYMTHQVEFIVGDVGREWVRLNETRKTVLQQKFGSLLEAKYRVVEGESAQQPAPGQYGILTGSASSLPPNSTTAILGQRSERFNTSYMKRPEMPEPGRYAVNTIRTAKSSPSFGFGTAPRIPPVRREQGAEPGAYKPLNCWTATGVSLRARPRPKVYEALVGYDPSSYNTERGLQLIQAKPPRVQLKTTGERSKVESGYLPAEVGPGTYDVKDKLQTHRSPEVTYRKPRPAQPIKKTTERPLSHFSDFC